MVINGNGSVHGQGMGMGMGGIGILGQSPEIRQLSPLTSPLLTDAGCVRNDDEDEARRKVDIKTSEKRSNRKFISGLVSSQLSVCVQKFPTDKAYFIAKELLTTERTYLKDLQVITEVRRKLSTHYYIFFRSYSNTHMGLL